MDDLNQIFKKYEFQANPRLDSALINRIERFIGFELPADYKCYLQNYSKFEDNIGKVFIALWDLESLLENNDGYMIKESLPSHLGIGSDGGGELIAIKYSNEQTYRIVLVPFIGMEEDVAIEIG